jgi:hypothetical protein
MTDQPSPEEVEQWHRTFGAGLFNATWDLIDKDERSDDDDVAMLLAAAASRWHWGRIGGPAEIATGDWQIAHVLSLLGEGGLALRFAVRSLNAAEAEGWSGWRLASAHEGMARAYAAAGDAAARDAHVASARSALATEPSDEERTVIEGQLATVPIV